MPRAAEPESAALAGALLLVGCGSVPTVTSDSGVGNTRQALVERAEQGAVPAVVDRQPLRHGRGQAGQPGDPGHGGGRLRLGVDFTTDPEPGRRDRAAPRRGCSTPRATHRQRCLPQPHADSTLPAGDELRVLAAFCDGAEPLGSVEAQDTVSGPTDRRFQRLLWRTASALFPDDYAETSASTCCPTASISASAAARSRRSETTRSLRPRSTIVDGTPE